MKQRAGVSLRGLRTFCVAARQLSFSAAAEALFITPSAVSHQIRNFEQEMGLTLFERSAREIKLTPVGQRLFDEASPLIAELDRIVSSHRHDAPRSTIRMSVQPFFASEYFVPRLGEFTADHPDLDIRVSASDESSEVHPADADLSIRLFRSPPADVAAKLIMPMTLVPAGSKAMAKSLTVEGDTVTSDLPLIVHESFPKAWVDWSKAAGVTLPTGGMVTRLDSMIAVVRAAEQGIGAALVPVPIANQWFEQGTITQLFETPLVADVSYFLTWRKDQVELPAIGVLRNWIERRFAAN